LLQDHSTAKAGMLLNTVTKEVFDGKKGITFIPACTQHVVVEWKPERGGFVAIHQLDSAFINDVRETQEFGKWKSIKGDPKSNDLIDTSYVYGISVKEDGSTEQMIVAFTSSKIKVYKRWVTKARTIQIATPSGARINPPLFAHRYRITTTTEKNAKGSFFNFDIGFDGIDAASCRLKTTDPLFQEAYSFADLIKSGNVKAAHDSAVEAGTDTTDIDQDIPFA
jgi:hypothetical protein